MSIISNLVNKYLNDLVTSEHVVAIFHKIHDDIGMFVTATSNKIDDVVWQEISNDIDLDLAATTTAKWIRDLIGLSPERRPMFAAPMESQPPPRLYCGLVRARLITETCRQAGVTRAEARAAVKRAEDEGVLNDDAIIAAAMAQGVNVRALADGTILDWLKLHLPDLLKIIETLLPLILALL